MIEKRYKIIRGLNGEIEDIIDHCKEDKHLGFSDFMIQINEQDKAHKKLKKENEQLKQENEFAKLLAKHRGEKVTFANSLIQDIDDELTRKMWYQFKEEMYQEWKKKRGIE